MHVVQCDGMVSMPEINIPTFSAISQTYSSDTCESLKAGVLRGEVHLSALVHGEYPGTEFPHDQLPEIRSVGYWNANYDQSWGLDWHRNEGLEITFVSRGRVEFGVDGDQIELRPGDLTITRPWQRHRLGDPDVTACKLSWLILDLGIRRPNQPWIWPDWLLLSSEELHFLTTILRQNEQPVWRASADVEFYFQRLNAIVEIHDSPPLSQIKLYVNGLLISLSAMLRDQNPSLTPSLTSSQRVVELFLKALPEQLDREWTVEDMAEACGLGKRRFTYYCQQITNLSPASYLARCRIDLASQLLRSNAEISVTDIALQVGFGSSQYFSTAFRAHQNMTPREYRMKYQQVVNAEYDPAV